MQTSLTIEINEIDTDIDVSYKVLRAEPDMGVNSPYIEVTDISTESDNECVRQQLREYETYIEVAEILEERGAAYV